jgi:hypothetical protein
MDGVKVGDGVSITIWTDTVAYTVIKRTESTMLLQQDTAKIINKDELTFIPGGFCAHCPNQGVQKWAHEPNPNGSIVKITRRLAGKGENRRICWKQAGHRTLSPGMVANPGRHTFHDYNF